MWVAREKNYSLFLYTIKPTRGENYWYADEGIHGYTDLDYCLCIPSELFPYLKWEDEPIEVELWSKEYWKRTIDDIIHKYIAKNDSGEYGCTNEIINSILNEICG